ncbi:uncharacterized protein N7496_008098 [Penicillium cataractarum]|uniref:Transcription factor domain-containing protein n=1 Tax=Penicillium cataractarum TaxID=2100454 RepID=A0A9W9S2F2_9EURO|nr:uncharacterized protein N7496_008098 [Penicillium cataractarum]KAJ5368338.1 hypothetical protein N7496_008098 [Penicillium cataractarum]
MSRSPMLINQIPASEHHANIDPIGHAVNGVSVATQPTKILHTESATMQPTTPEPELPRHDENRASNGLGVSERSNTARPTQIPPPESTTMQPSALEQEMSENNDNSDSSSNVINGTSATRQTQNTRMEPATIQPPASGFEPFLSTSFGLHVSEFGQTIVSGLSRPSEEVLDLWWDNCNFVRDGWLTAQEAVTYLDLFSQYLAPFSYIISQDFLSHKNHGQLLKEDPMLCCTLLVISSRFFVLPGPGGLSRSHSIHNHLWKHYEVLTHRVLRGEENYFAAKSRVLGAIESLMLISDWHPRSFQLPCDNLDWAETTMHEGDRRKIKQRNRDATSIRWQEDVFGPMSQSTRKSWRLLGVALNLASEARIFSDEPLVSLGFDTRQATRFHRTRKLLYIYVAQMASRLGCSSLLPENLNFNSTSKPQDNEPRGRWWDSWMTLWLDLTKLMNSAFVCFSPSRPAMKQVIAGNYDLLHLDWIPSLAHWNERFKSQSSGKYKYLQSSSVAGNMLTFHDETGMPVDLVYLLSIEYHHLEACISALVIQAVVERAEPQTNGQSEIPETHNPRPSMLPDDRTLIDKTVSACCEVLNLATIMQVGGRLRYTPLRTRLCIISASILLLKAISLGGLSHDVKISLGTLDQCIAGLRSCGVDDLDYLPRYAELVDKHLQQFREQFTLLQGQPGQNLVGKEPSRDDWVVRPFDLRIAPCSSDRKAIPLGISSNSLDFLLELLESGGKRWCITCPYEPIDALMAN